MRAVIQRVLRSSVLIDKKESRFIHKGLLVLIGIEDNDTEEDAEWLSKKIPSLRVFDDNEGVMNLSLEEAKGELMVISQFTLHASTKKGNRPSWFRAAAPGKAIPLYHRFIELLKEKTCQPVITGEFGAHMEIELINDGPVTIIMDTKNKE